MRKLGLSFLFLLVSSVISLAAAEWPTTREGQLARGWVEAFSAGETSMQTFVEFNLAPENLASRSMEERMASYRKLHKSLGTLRLIEVTQAQAGELSVVLASSEKDERHETVFRVQLEEPRKLLGVELSMRQSHGLFGH